MCIASSCFVMDEAVPFPDYCGSSTYEGQFTEEAKDKKCVVFHDYPEFNTSMYQNSNTIAWIYLPSTLIVKEGSFVGSSIETVISPNLSEVEQYAFSNCNKLLQIQSPKLSIIRMSSFENCTSLYNISSTTLTKIEPFAFKSCKQLKNIDLSIINEISDEAFAESGLNCIHAGNAIKIGTAFHFLPNLLHISIPKVTELSYNAFSSCSSLTSVSAESLVKLGMSTFSGCSSLQNITLTKVTFIGDYAFADCTSLETIEAPLVEEVGQGAFSNSGVRVLKMPNLSSIGEFAFSMCQNLISIDIPNLKKIPASAFAFSTFKNANFSSVVELEGDTHFMSSLIENIDLSTLQNVNLNAKSIFSGVPNLTTVYIGCTPPNKFHNETFSKSTKIYLPSKKCFDNYKNETVLIDGKLFYSGGQLVAADERPEDKNRTYIYIICGIVSAVVIIVIVVVVVLCFRKKKYTNIPGVAQESLLQ